VLLEILDIIRFGFAIAVALMMVAALLSLVKNVLKMKGN
jgi:hypothetical protein